MNASLFEPVLPEGFRHADGFLPASEEAELVERFRALEFHEVRMRGVAARRRVVQYGWKYSFESFRMTQGPPLPDYLVPLRDRAAEHGIPAMKTLRYSITFRTLKR